MEGEGTGRAEAGEVGDSRWSRRAEAWGQRDSLPATSGSTEAGAGGAREGLV